MLLLLACLIVAEDELGKRIENLKKIVKERKGREEQDIRDAIESAEVKLDSFQPPEMKLIFEPKEFTTKMQKIKSFLIDASPPGSKFSTLQKLRAAMGSKKDRKIRKQTGYAFIAGSKGNFTFRCAERGSRVDRILFSPVPDDECSIRRFRVHGMERSRYLPLGEFELKKGCDEFQEFNLTRGDVDSWKIEVLDNWGGPDSRIYGAKMIRYA